MARYPSTAPTHIQFGPGGISPAVQAILVACAAVFLVSLVFRQEVLTWLGLIPVSVVHDLRIWQPVTYIFVHAGVMHLAFNMLIVWMFGVELERLWGTRAFTKFFFICGVTAGLATLAIALLPIDAAWRERTYLGVTVGASGAIYGLLYAWARAFPYRTVLMFLIFPMQARWFVAILIAIDFAIAAQTRLSSGTAHLAHFAGLLAAYVYLNNGSGRGPGGLVAEIKYRYLKWKMNQLRRKFDVHEGGRDKKPWVH
ncbi:MAG TPA: rhomboid family intramembrane serine protease [Vicinamibacterales bacterium]|nr:rhomboid family intramembrane serine protease [Vicinamibacterales bacterium]